MLLYAIIQTGLSEELFFRGFLLKRFAHTFGFQIGNILQSLLFGSIHGLMLFSAIPFGVVVLVVIVTGLAGYLMGWMNEKKIQWLHNHELVYTQPLQSDCFLLRYV